MDRESYCFLQMRMVKFNSSMDLSVIIDPTCFQTVQGPVYDLSNQNFSSVVPMDVCI